MMKFINQFVKDEDGAVTVDWVVLTAAVVGLGIAGVAAVQGGIESLAGSIESQLDSATVVSLGELGQGGTAGEGEGEGG